MKILLCNKFYYRRGGDCIYMLALEQLLREKGHEVAVFAMQHPDNLPTPWSRYFPSEVDFHNKRHALKAVLRPLGISTVAYHFNKLLRDFQPDVVHFNNIHSQLSPILIEAAHRRHIATVWTMHDYKLLCPRYDCLQGGKTPCTECFDDPKAVVKHRCMKGSALASALAYAEARRWERHRVARWVDAFVAPSDFMRQQLVAAGIPAERVHHLQHFIDTERCAVPDYEKGEYYCYVGRLSPEKGVRTLLEAAAGLDRPLKIVGDGPLRAELEAQYGGTGRVEFLGFLDWEQIKEVVRHARCAVVPSEWYEVFGLVIMEAFCLGTPVVGARIGAIPELITPDSGALFTPGDAAALRRAIDEVCSRTYNYPLIAHRALATFTQEGYYRRLESLYHECMRRRTRG
jgi:glycosyltransferase involved in cell wall biosynthesis